MIDRIEGTTDHESAPAEAAPVTNTSTPVADASTHVAPAAAPATKPRNSLKPIVTQEDRFARGNFRIKEAAPLCGVSVSSINKYLKLGLLPRVKCGGCTCIPGPALARFKRGE
jgi:hypothetical protein